MIHSPFILIIVLAVLAAPASAQDAKNPFDVIFTDTKDTLARERGRVPGLEASLALAKRHVKELPGLMKRVHAVGRLTVETSKRVTSDAKRKKAVIAKLKNAKPLADKFLAEARTDLRKADPKKGVRIRKAVFKTRMPTWGRGGRNGMVYLDANVFGRDKLLGVRWNGKGLRKVAMALAREVGLGDVALWTEQTGIQAERMVLKLKDAKAEDFAKLLWPKAERLIDVEAAKTLLELRIPITHFNPPKPAPAKKPPEKQPG